MYHDDIKAPMVTQEMPDQSITMRLRCYFAELNDIRLYRDTYTDILGSSDWSILATYFQQALADLCPQKHFRYLGHPHPSVQSYAV